MLVGVSLLAFALADKNSFLKSGAELMTKEQKAMKGGNMKLSKKEEKVNKYLMKLKKDEMETARSDLNGQNFPPAMHFFKSKERIDNSKIFKIIKAMPKGWYICIVSVHIFNPFVYLLYHTCTNQHRRSLKRFRTIQV